MRAFLILFGFYLLLSGSGCRSFHLHLQRNRLTGLIPAIAAMIVLEQFSFLGLGGCLEDFLAGHFESLIVALRALNGVEMAGIFLDLDEAGLFVLPYVIVNGEH